MFNLFEGLGYAVEDLAKFIMYSIILNIVLIIIIIILLTSQPQKSSFAQLSKTPIIIKPIDTLNSGNRNTTLTGPLTRYTAA
jgi:hypothetical protein